MPRFEIDLTTADIIPDADYVAIIKSITAKPSKDGESTNFNWMLAIPALNGRTLFHNTNSKIPSMIKAMMDAAKVSYDKTGFDPNGAVDKQINIRVRIKEDDYGIQNVVTKVWAV